MSTDTEKQNDSYDLMWLDELIEFSEMPKKSMTDVRNDEQSAAREVRQGREDSILEGLGRIRLVYREEQKKKWRDSNRWRTGYRRSEEDRRRISQGHQRRKSQGIKRARMSDESRARLSQVMKAKFADGFKRPPVTEQVRAQMREAHAARKQAGIVRKSTDWKIAKEKAKLTRELNALLGLERKPVSEEAKKKLKAAWVRLKKEGYVRKPVTEEGRANISAAQRKRFAEHGAIKHTDETKRKMSEAYARRLESGWKPPKRSPESIAKGLATKEAKRKMREQGMTASPKTTELE